MSSFFRKIFKRTDKSSEGDWDADEAGLATTLMREFCAALRDDYGIDGHFEDAEDLFYEGLGNLPATYERLKNIDEVTIGKISNLTRDYYERADIKGDFIKKVIKITLWHWKPEN